MMMIVMMSAMVFGISEADGWVGSFVCGVHASEHGSTAAETHRRTVHSHHARGMHRTLPFTLIFSVNWTYRSEQRT